MRERGAEVHHAEQLPAGAIARGRKRRAGRAISMHRSRLPPALIRVSARDRKKLALTRPNVALLVLTR